MRKRKTITEQVSECCAATGLTLLGRAHSGDKTRQTKWLVKYDCCGRERELFHKTIFNRKANNTILCRSCSAFSTADICRARRDGQKRKLGRARKAADLTAPYGITPPMWPVPPGAMVGENIPFFDRCCGD